MKALQILVVIATIFMLLQKVNSEVEKLKKLIN